MPEGGSPPALVLFDLDGTLADTFPDLLWALRRALEERGLPPPEAGAVRARVSQGGRSMTECTAAGGSADAEPVHHRFLELYGQNVAVRTRLFPGMDRVLDTLESRGTGIGVVTSKRSCFSEPLIDALGLRARLACLVSGDGTPRSKPHPDPLLHAAREAGTPAGRCVYVGDARNDVLAARAAGMGAAVATYGYLPPGEDPALWQADVLLAEPVALLDWL